MLCVGGKGCSSAVLQSKLQTALSRLSELVGNHGQRVVVDPPVESKTVSALKAQAPALWSWMRLLKDEVANRMEAVDKIALSEGRVTAVRGGLSALLGRSKEGAIRGHCEIGDSLGEKVGQL